MKRPSRPGATWPSLRLALPVCGPGTGDLQAADQHSRVALATWDQLTGFRDVRMQGYLWRVRAAVLVNKGDAAGAKQLQAQALEAAPHRRRGPTVKDAGYVGM